MLTETHLRSGEVFRFSNYFCHPHERSTERGGSEILVRRYIDHHSVPVEALQHLKATAIQIMLASKPVKFRAFYLSPTRLLIMSQLSACFGGVLPVLIAGALNAKHVDWNFWLITKKADFCVIMLIKMPALSIGRTLLPLYLKAPLPTLMS